MSVTVEQLEKAFWGCPSELGSMDHLEHIMRGLKHAEFEPLKPKIVQLVVKGNQLIGLHDDGSVSLVGWNDY